jgi:trafficking protein particle complex subunit 5
MHARGRRLVSGEPAVPAVSAATGGRPRNILDANLTQPRGEVNRDAYLVLFAELVGYCRNRVESVTALETKLSELGYRIGMRSLDLIAARDRGTKREVRLLNALNMVVVNVWKCLFNRQADSLKKVRDSEDEFYIEEAAPMVNRYVSVPRDYGDLNCAAFSAGIINGVLDSAGFPASVTAKVHARSAPSEPNSGGYTQPLTIYYIKFDDAVIAREKRLNG